MNFNLHNIKAYLLLLLIALFMLGANPFKAETIAPMDLLVKYPGWKNTHIKVDYINGERSDVLDAKLPIWINAKRTLWTGEIPFWNHQRAGKPGLTFTNSLFTPAFIIFTAVKNDALGFYLSNLANVLIGLLGMFFLLRQFFNAGASFFGAIVFMFSGFNAAWFFWAHVDTAIWTPWVLYTVYLYISTQNKKYLLLMTLSMLMLNLGGFPMVAVMTYMSVALMVLIFLISKKIPLMKWFNIISFLALFSLLSVLIALPFIYPLIELLDWIGGIGYRTSGSGFRQADFALFYNPNLYSHPRVETTFYVGILPVIFLFLSFILVFFRPSFISIFALILFGYALTISFVLIDINLIRKIPTLDSSLLTRFGYLLGFSLAIISAYTLHTLSNIFRKWKGIYILMFLFLFIQIVQQKTLFSHFNKPVPNESFYPITKSINYIQQNIQPLEHILADSGYLIAGTLGGYGLNDWFAHSFHTSDEKTILRKIVSNPFKTPTSSMFHSSQINLNSPYMDYLGIKYLLVTNLSLSTAIPFWNNERERQPCPILPHNTLEQHFDLNQTYSVEGIQLHIAIYGEKHASSDIELLLKKDTETIDTLVVNKMSINDNSWVSFKFNATKILKKGHYSIHLKMLDTHNAKALTVWSNKNETSHPLLVNGEEVALSFQMRFMRNKKFNPKYHILNLEPGIHILENKNIKDASYFIESIDTHSKPNYTHTQTYLLSNTRIHIKYTGENSGWVVLPMHYYPGWEARVNGNLVKIATFLNMMPAVKVNPKSDIIMTYKPNYNKYTYTLSILSIFLLLFMALKFRKRD